MIKRRHVKVYRDTTHFISSWLTASPSELRSSEINMEKRLTTILEALGKEKNVLKFKPKNQ
jgi:hypothetical protein